MKSIQQELKDFFHDDDHLHGMRIQLYRGIFGVTYQELPIFHEIGEYRDEMNTIIDDKNAETQTPQD